MQAWCRGERRPKTACRGRNQWHGPVQEHHPEASTISACFSRSNIVSAADLLVPAPRPLTYKAQLLANLLISSYKKQQVHTTVSFCSSEIVPVLTYSQQEMYRVFPLPWASSPCLPVSLCPTYPHVWKGRWWLYLKPQSSWALNRYKQRTHQQCRVSLTDCFLILFGILSWLHRKLIIKSCLCSIDYICGSLRREYEAWQTESEGHGWWKPLPRWQGPNCSAVAVIVEMKIRAPWSAPGYPGGGLAVAILLTRSVPHATNKCSKRRLVLY